MLYHWPMRYQFASERSDRKQLELMFALAPGFMALVDRERAQTALRDVAAMASRQAAS